MYVVHKKKHMNIYHKVYFPLAMIYYYSKELEVVEVDIECHFLVSYEYQEKNNMKSVSNDPSSSS